MIDATLKTASFGRWAVLGTLGKGGQGDVYLVADATAFARPDQASDWRSLALLVLKPQRRIGAIKVRRGKSIKAAARFTREVNVLRDCAGAGLVPVIDFSESWFVTPYYPNGTLADSHDVRIDPLAVLRTALPLAHTVARFHERGYVHRDIKPANVFVDQLGKWILGDCGIAFAEDEPRLTETDERVGSRDWIAPWLDLGRAEEMTPAADCYSFGKLMWSMMVGQQLLPRHYGYDHRLQISSFLNNTRASRWVDGLLYSLVTEHEKSCVQDGSTLSAEIAKAIDALEHDLQVMKHERRCSCCGQGVYRRIVDFDHNAQHNFGLNVVGQPKFRVLVCELCGHVDLFFSGAGKSSLDW